MQVKYVPCLELVSFTSNYTFENERVVINLETYS